MVTTWDQGLRMQVDATCAEDDDAPIDMLFVPGGPGIDQASAHGETLAWLRRRGPQARRTCSVCTGAFLPVSYTHLEVYKRQPEMYMSDSRPVM